MDGYSIKPETAAEELSADDWVMIGNAVRNMVRMCRDNEFEIKRDLAYDRVYADGERPEQLAMLALAGETTNEYTALYERLHWFAFLGRDAPRRA